MATGAADERPRQQQAPELFEEKHAELVAEARGVAREFGADVRVVAFRPGCGGGGAVQHDFQGMPRDARVVGTIRRAVARDVSAMGLEEVEQHERQLRGLRAVVERELRAREAAAKARAAAAAKRSPEKEEAGGGESKIRRIIID